MENTNTTYDWVVGIICIAIGIPTYCIIIGSNICAALVITFLAVVGALCAKDIGMADGLGRAAQANILKKNEHYVVAGIFFHNGTHYAVLKERNDSMHLIVLPKYLEEGPLHIDWWYKWDGQKLLSIKD